MSRLLTVSLILISLASCSPAVYRTYDKNKTEEAKDCGLALVRIHPPDSTAEKIGEILIDDFGASVNCSEEKTLDYIKNEGCTVGAQIVLIREIKRPNDESFCYRCTAVFYKYKPGASPIKTNKYFDEMRIKKREQLDRKKQIHRTVRIIHTTAHIVHMFTCHRHG
jgi:hypothetical protein